MVKRSGMTQDEIAAKMGTSKGYISQLVSGNPEPTLRKLQQLADIIGCKRWEFFKDEMEQGGEILPEKPTQQTSLKQAIVCPHCGKALKITVE